MTSPRHRRWLVPAAAGALLLGAAPALPQLDDSFMPKGGKTLLLQILAEAGDGGDLLAILSARRSEGQWRQALAPRAAALSEREQSTLAAYLAVNMPVANPGEVAQREGQTAELYAALPRDGRELAWHECQFCHSLFTSHLMQDRSLQAWMNMFESPFHREMKMTPQEREEFSRYSAINMPMKIEDVPPDLRF